MFSKSAHEHKDSSGKYLTEHLVEGTFKKLQRKSLQKYSDVAVSSLVAAPWKLCSQKFQAFKFQWDQPFRDAANKLSIFWDSQYFIKP